MSLGNVYMGWRHLVGPLDCSVSFAKANVTLPPNMPLCVANVCKRERECVFVTSGCHREREGERESVAGPYDIVCGKCVCVCVCVCLWQVCAIEREKERDNVAGPYAIECGKCVRERENVCACLWQVCVQDKERERERERETVAAPYAIGLLYARLYMLVTTHGMPYLQGLFSQMNYQSLGSFDERELQDRAIS